MAIVEVGQMGVQAGKTPMDASTPDGILLLDAWKAVTTAPGGPARVYWGTEVEDPSWIWAWFDWSSLEEHQEFAESFGGEITNNFGQIFTPGFTKHAYLDTSVLKSPVTEVMLAFFPATITPAQQSAISTQFAAFKSAALDQCKHVRGVSAGWGHETDFPIRGSGDRGSLESEEGSLFFALIGWGSVGEHMAFRETDGFKENVGLVGEMEGCVGLDMFHLECEVLERADEK